MQRDATQFARQAVYGDASAGIDDDVGTHRQRRLPPCHVVTTSGVRTSTALTWITVERASDTAPHAMSMPSSSRRARTSLATRSSGNGEPAGNARAPFDVR